jgi:tRNA(Ile)-lysidine synthase
VPDLSGLDPRALFAPLAGRERLGLAVSGGPDSLALMLLAAQWAAGMPDGPRLFVYTVDHGLRPEAAEEAAMVVREAGELGLPARLLRWEGAKPATGVQAAARAARYRLLAAAMQADDVAIIATAHHLGDQAETVLMRLAHGSGIEGLRGMDGLTTIEGCTVWRPLLGVRPEVLRAVVDAAGLSPAMDPGNADTDYERVRWRLMLPALEAMGLSLERLGTLARRMDEATALIRQAAAEAFAALVVRQGEDRAALPHRRLAALPPPVAASLLGQVLRAVSGDARPVPLGPLEALARRVHKPDPLKGMTLHGCVVTHDGDTIVVRREGPRSAVLKATSAATAN